MLHIPKIDDYLKILTDEDIKEFVAIKDGAYFQSTKKNWILN